MEGSFTISGKGISYETEKNSVVEINPSSDLTEAQRIHKKLLILIEDLRKSEITLQSLEIVVEGSWEYKMRLLCNRLYRNSEDSSTNLQDFYLLGEKINDNKWGDLA